MSSVAASRTRVAFDSRRPIRSAGFGIGVVEPARPVTPAPTVRLTSDPVKVGELNRRIYEWSQANMPFDGDDAAWEAFRLARSAEHSRIQDEVFRVEPATSRRAQDDDYVPSQADQQWNAEHESNQRDFYVVGERRRQPVQKARQKTTHRLPHRHSTPDRLPAYKPLVPAKPHTGKPVKSFSVVEPAGVDFQSDWAYTGSARKPSTPRMTHAEAVAKRAAELRPSGSPANTQQWDSYYSAIERLEASEAFA